MAKRWTILIAASLAALLSFLSPAPVTRADIFQWEYINPADPSQGKQPSTMLAPDGAGVSAETGANLSYRDLTMAYLIGANLSPGIDSNYNSYDSDLTGANLTQADLTNANLIRAKLTNANFTQADLVNAKLFLATLTNANLSRANLTNAEFRGASLVNANLSQANLTNADFDGTLSPYYSAGEADLTGANLSGANLTNANFRNVPLTGATLTGAEVRRANFSRNTTDPLALPGLTVAQLSSTASYQAHDLTGIKLEFNLLAGVNLAGQNLTNAAFYAADLTGANLTGAQVRGADLRGRFTADQLYSTASYQARQLSGISLHYLPGANLSGQDLTFARFLGDFAGANFSRANLTYSSFQTPYGGTLANADFSHANLNGAGVQADLTGANFTSAEVRGANFSYSTLTKAQLYSTASYQAQDLTGIILRQTNNLAGVNLAGQNLTKADFAGAMLANANFSQANLTSASFAVNYPYEAADLTGANLSQANLRNADFGGYDDDFYGYRDGAKLAGANLTGADARGANFYLARMDGAITTNLIQPDGHVAGLDLTSGALLLVRDYDGNPASTPPTGPLPIVVEEHLTMDATGTLRLVFDADPWDSTISFAPGISVALGGALELTFAPDVDVATQSGRTIDLFDWTGVTPTGAFTVSSPYAWDLSKLYTTGEVTLTSVGGTMPGDFNNDGEVDAADLLKWQGDFGENGSSDADNDNDSDGADFLAWQRQLGGGSPTASTAQHVPEPIGASLAVATLLVAISSGRCRRA
jgi:uncharacterized protein YjbI with pentapeptide repeats